MCGNFVDDGVRLALDGLAVDRRQNRLACGDERAVDGRNGLERGEPSELCVGLEREPGVLHGLNAAVADSAILQAPFQVADTYGVREHTLFLVHLVGIVEEPAEHCRAAWHVVDGLLVELQFLVAQLRGTVLQAIFLHQVLDDLDSQEPREVVDFVLDVFHFVIVYG